MSNAQGEDVRDNVHTNGVKVLRCPNCGGNIPTTDAGKIAFTCPNCQATLVNEDNKFVENFRRDRIPRRYIPFTMSREALEQRMLNDMVNRHAVPLDIFDEIKILDINAYFLPMVYFEGVYEARGNGTINETVRSGSETVRFKRTETIIAGDNYQLLCCACDDKTPIPAGLYSFAHSNPDNNVDLFHIRISQEISLEEIMKSGADLSAVNPNFIEGADSVWYKLGEQLIKARADKKIKEEAKRRFARLGEHVTQIVHSSAYNGTYLLAPFWYVAYSYKGGEFCYSINGLGTSYSLFAPVDKRLKAVSRNGIIVGTLATIGAIVYAVLMRDQLHTSTGSTIYISVIFALITILGCAIVRNVAFSRECRKIRAERGSRI